LSAGIRTLPRRGWFRPTLPSNERGRRILRSANTIKCAEWWPRNTRH
jgi:hypothetical protein